MMIIEKLGNKGKPKNYSRNLLVCICQCIITNNKIVIDRIMVKYEVEPNKDRISDYGTYTPKINKGRNTWSSYQFWGEFKQVLELPQIFYKLEEKDFIIKTGYFTRDCIQMPFIYEIEIVNFQKYNNIKTKDDRRNKLRKIIN